MNEKPEEVQQNEPQEENDPIMGLIDQLVSEFKKKKEESENNS